MLSPHHSSERAAQQQDEIARQEARPGAQARVARPRLRYANVVASLALFVALGGSSYAAVELSKGSVKQKHIAKNAVTSKKVKDASLLARDFAPNQLPVASKAERGEKGDTGPQGPKGDTGPQGIPGPVDTADFETKVARSGDTLSGAVTTVGAPGQSSGFVGDSWGAVLPEGVAEPTFDFVTTPDTQCPGVGQATAGRLCIYVISENNRNDGYAYVVGDWWNATNRRYGWAFELEWLTPTPGAFGWLSASWAYQVP